VNFDLLDKPAARCPLSAYSVPATAALRYALWDSARPITFYNNTYTKKSFDNRLRNDTIPAILGETMEISTQKAARASSLWL